MGTSNTAWWEHYIDGKIVCREDIPQSIIQTMEDYATRAGKGDAMWRLSNGKPVEPRKLRREIEDCIHSNELEKERQRLKDLEVWAIRECALAETAKALREAHEAFADAARTAGLDHYDVALICAHHTNNLPVAKIVTQSGSEVFTCSPGQGDGDPDTNSELDMKDEELQSLYRIPGVVGWKT